MPTSDGRGQTLWLQPPQPGLPVQLRLSGLLPNRCYRIRPGERSFARTDRAGVLHLTLLLDGPELLAIEPVI